VPAAIQVLKPDVITMSVGGDDLQRILVEGLDPYVVLEDFAGNMGQILCGLRAALPNAVIIVGNQYDIPNLSADVPAVRQVIMVANGLLAGVAQACGAKVADVFSAFDGRHGLLLGERKGALDPYEMHPTDAGYRVMAKAFEEAAKQ
jgi:lysophospholipase L1-like esterase